MNIAFFITIAVVFGKMLLQKGHLIRKLTLVPSLFIGSIAFWLFVVLPYIPSQWQLLDIIPLQTWASDQIALVTGRQQTTKDQIINDFRSIVEIDEDGNRQAPSGEVDLDIIPTPVRGVFDNMKDNVDERRAAEDQQKAGL